MDPTKSKIRSPGLHQGFDKTKVGGNYAFLRLRNMQKAAAPKSNNAAEDGSGTAVMIGSPELKLNEP
jgi:hypothetical protein